jgi:hypothetical protein
MRIKWDSVKKALRHVSDWSTPKKVVSGVFTAVISYSTGRYDQFKDKVSVSRGEAIGYSVTTMNMEAPPNGGLLTNVSRDKDAFKRGRYQFLPPRTISVNETETETSYTVRPLLDGSLGPSRHEDFELLLNADIK